MGMISPKTFGGEGGHYWECKDHDPGNACLLLAYLMLEGSWFWCFHQVFLELQKRSWDSWVLIKMLQSRSLITKKWQHQWSESWECAYWLVCYILPSGVIAHSPSSPEWLLTVLPFHSAVQMLFWSWTGKFRLFVWLVLEPPQNPAFTNVSFQQLTATAAISFPNQWNMRCLVPVYDRYAIPNF